MSDQPAKSLEKLRRPDPAELRAISKQTAKVAPASVEAFFQANKGALTALVADVVKPDRLLKVAQTAIRQTPRLQECTIASLFGAVVICATIGLEPNTHEGHCWLIPRRRSVPRRDERGNIVKSNGRTEFQDVWEVNVQIGYKGRIALAYRSPKVKLLKTVVAFENDELEILEGTEQRISHKPFVSGDRGDPIGYYAVAKLDTGETLYEWMSIADIMRIRDTFSDAYKQADMNITAAQRVIDSGAVGKALTDAQKTIAKNMDIPWIRDFDQQARKTTINRISNYLPGTPQGALAQALDARDSAMRSQSLGGYIEGEPLLADEDETDDQAPTQGTTQKTISEEVVIHHDIKTDKEKAPVDHQKEEQDQEQHKQQQDQQEDRRTAPDDAQAGQQGEQTKAAGADDDGFGDAE